LSEDLKRKRTLDARRRERGGWLKQIARSALDDMERRGSLGPGEAAQLFERWLDEEWAAEVRDAAGVEQTFEVLMRQEGFYTRIKKRVALDQSSKLLRSRTSAGPRVRWGFKTKRELSRGH
jgi:hypothetical protein